MYSKRSRPSRLVAAQTLMTSLSLIRILIVVTAGTPRYPPFAIPGWYRRSIRAIPGVILACLEALLPAKLDTLISLPKCRVILKQHAFFIVTYRFIICIDLYWLLQKKEMSVLDYYKKVICCQFDIWYILSFLFDIQTCSLTINSNAFITQNLKKSKYRLVSKFPLVGS